MGYSDPEGFKSSIAGSGVAGRFQAVPIRSLNAGTWLKKGSTGAPLHLMPRRNFSLASVQATARLGVLAPYDIRRERWG
jgi:hypothetical protein